MKRAHPPLHIAMLSIHTSPLARLGSKEAGGMNVYVRALAHHLAQQGIAVDIFTRRYAPDLPDQQTLAPGVRLVHLNAGPAAPYDKNRILDHLDDLRDGVAAFVAATGARYHLIHSHYWVSGVLALALREHWQVPVVQMFHTLGAMKNSVARSAEETETRERIAIERNLLHAVDLTVAATPLDQQQMVRHYAADPQRIRVIPGGVDTTQFQPTPRPQARAQLNLPPEIPLLLGIGRLEPLKGFDALIEAAAHLHTHHPQRFGNLRVLLVGGGDETQPATWNSEQQRLHALRTHLGLTEYVTFLGAQPHTRLPLFYAAVDAFVMPSHYESFGLAALEALACGALVVASDVGGLRYTIEDEHSGLLVPPHDPPALAERLAHVLGDPQQQAHLRANARQRALHYSWPRIAAAITTLYTDLIQSAATHAGPQACR